jgi:hypothetical protein
MSADDPGVDYEDLDRREYALEDTGLDAIVDAFVARNRRAFYV